MKEDFLNQPLREGESGDFDVGAIVKTLSEDVGTRQSEVFLGLDAEQRHQVFEELKSARLYHAIVYNAIYFDEDLTDVVREATEHDWRFMSHVGHMFVPDRYDGVILRLAAPHAREGGLHVMNDMILHTSHMDGLTENDYRWFAEFLIETPDGAHVLAYGFNHFIGLDPNEWVWKCLKRVEDPKFVFMNLEKFEGVATVDFARRCAEDPDLFAHVVLFIHKFDQSIHKEIFHVLADMHLPRAAVNQLLRADDSRKYTQRTDVSFRGLGEEELRMLEDRPLSAMYVVGEDLDEDRERENFFDLFLSHKASFGDLPDQQAVDFWLERGLGKKIIENFRAFRGPFNRETSLWFLRNVHLGDPLRGLLGRAREGLLDVSMKEVFDVWWHADHPSNEHDILAEHLNTFSEFLDDDKLRQISRWGHSLYVGKFVAEQYDRHDRSQHPALVERLFAVGASRYVRMAEGMFDVQVSDDEFARHLADDGEVRELMNDKRRFFGSHNQVIDVINRLIQSGRASDLLENIGQFVNESNKGDVDFQQLVHECVKEYAEKVAWARRNGVGIAPVTEHVLWKKRGYILDAVEGSEPDEGVALDLIANGHAKMAMQWYQNSAEDFVFDPERGQRIMDALFEYEAFGAIGRHIGLFGDTVDRNSVAQRMFELKKGRFLYGNMDDWTGLTDETAQYFLVESGVNALMLHPESFVGLSEDTNKKALSIAVADDDIAEAVAFNRKMGSPDVVLDRLDKAFGTLFSSRVYAIAHRIVADEQPDPAVYRKEIGIKITLGGVRGLNQLVMGLRALRSKIVHGQIAERDVRTDFQLHWMADVTRFFQSEWGDKDFESFKRMVQGYFRHQHLMNEDSRASLPEGFEHSPVFNVGRLDERAARSFEYTEGFLRRYEDLMQSLLVASWAANDDRARTEGLSHENRGLGQILSRIRGVAEEILERLDEQESDTLERVRVEGKNVDRVKAAYDLARSELAQIDFERISHPQEMFLVLRQHREFDEPLRQLMFYFAMRKYPGLVDEIFSKSVDRPSRAGISWMMNVVQHITHQETIAPLVTDGHAQKELADLLSVSVLQQEYERWQRHASGTIGTAPVQMRFQRDVLTELSGHIGDACWAPHSGDALGESDVLQNFPHFSSFTLIGNPNHPRFERFVGAGFVIDGKNTDGEDVMIIRGNNPIENFINQVDPYDFLFQQVEHFENIAQTRNMKLAIVIDYQGGAGTNRPALQGVYDELKLMFSSLPETHVSLADVPETAFNGYNLSGITYYISAHDMQQVVRAHRGEVAIADSLVADGDAESA